MNELLQTERSYVADLKCVIEVRTADSVPSVHFCPPPPQKKKHTHTRWILMTKLINLSVSKLHCLLLVIFTLIFVYLFATFAEYGNQQEHRQQDTWALLGLAPFVREQGTVHNTGISLLPWYISPWFTNFVSEDAVLTTVGARNVCTWHGLWQFTFPLYIS